MGCPCHLVHNIAGHASEAFQRAAGFDVEDLCVDVFYWFDKSTKRKGILREFCSFCDNDYREVVRYVSVRWLSLEKAVYRILQLYNSLQSYFRSEAESQPRFKRLAATFEKPLTEVYLLFSTTCIHSAESPSATGRSKYLSCFRFDPSLPQKDSQQICNLAGNQNGR